VEATARSARDAALGLVNAWQRVPEAERPGLTPAAKALAAWAEGR
jgi:hypothetical protein